MKNPGIARRVADLGDHVRERSMHSRMEKQDRDNDRLRMEVSLLRDDLEAERDTLKEALKRLEAREVTVKRSRKPHPIRTLVIAAGAYILGTRDGRERCDRSSRGLGRFSRASRDAFRNVAKNGSGLRPGPEVTTALLLKAEVEGDDRLIV
jgi:hypothetical protein